MVDNPTTAGRILNMFSGGCWARRQLHAGIEYVPMRSILMELQAGDLKNLMADSSTTACRILIPFHGGCWARRQLHAGIRYVSVAPKLMKLLSSVEGVRVALVNSTPWLIPPQPLGEFQFCLLEVVGLDVSYATV